jgi:hypothetical protein
VVARISGGEGEFADAAAALLHDAVVVVEDFVDGYEDALCGVCEWWETRRRREWLPSLGFRCTFAVRWTTFGLCSDLYIYSDPASVH